MAGNGLKLGWEIALDLVYLSSKFQLNWVTLQGVTSKTSWRGKIWSGWVFGPKTLFFSETGALKAY